MFLLWFSGQVCTYIRIGILHTDKSISAHTNCAHDNATFFVSLLYIIISTTSCDIMICMLHLLTLRIRSGMGKSHKAMPGKFKANEHRWLYFTCMQFSRRKLVAVYKAGFKVIRYYWYIHSYRNTERLLWTS